MSLATGGAPARLLALGDRLARDTRQGLCGDELGAGVEEVVACRERRGLAALPDLRDGGDSELGHLPGVLRGVRGEDSLLDVAHPLAASVDGDDEGLALAVGGLQRGVRALARGFVDRVDDVDVGVAGEALLHRLATAVDGALGRLVAGDLVVAALATGVLAGLRLLG